MESFLNDWTASTQPIQNTLRMEHIADLHDGSFEPQIRARSNTWPCPRPENVAEPISEEFGSTKASNQNLPGDSQQSQQNIAVSKKNSSRRNAWGNLSYADLITHAIGSAVDKRLTLSQIYEWMVQNVPYFKDKGDSNSSAGWKNSIRHNLSLHNRFMRVQNEGTGKSSWWMLNPDAKPGKSVRRRAASMETSRYDKKRGRAKKRVEALRSAGITGLNDTTPSPSSSVSEGLDHFSDSPLHSSGGFQLSPDFRQRASSNASSCGRLSPIPAIVGVEPDWGCPSQSSDYQTATISAAQATVLDQLAGSLAEELTLQKDFIQGFSSASGIPNQPPPAYQSPQIYAVRGALAQSYGIQGNQCPLHRLIPCTCMHTREAISPPSGTCMSPPYPSSGPSSDSLNTYNAAILDTGNSTMNNNSNLEDNSASTLIGQCMEALNNQAQIDEFHIDNFHGGLECNIEELIQQEMNIDGLLDINIPLNTANQTTSDQTSTSNVQAGPSSSSAVDSPQNQANSHSKVQYSQASVTAPSWVH